MMRLGIDPGLTGALALVTPDKELVQVWDMPVQAKTHGKGNELDAYRLADIFDECIGLANEAGERLVVILERVNAMPGQGVSSMFSFGMSYGEVRGAAKAMGLGVKYVTPQKWKRQAGLVKKPKEAALGLVIETWPDRRDLFARKKDVGRADAALIALYGKVEVEVIE